MMKIFTFTKRWIFALIHLLIFVSASAQVQPSFITVLDSTSITVTAQDRIKFNAYQADSSYSKKYLIALGNFESFLSGKYLDIAVPDTTLTLTFETESAILHPDGSLYWTGISTDGSTFLIHDLPESYRRHDQDIRALQ